MTSMLASLVISAFTNIPDIPVPADDLTREEECFIKVLCETKKRIVYKPDKPWSQDECDMIGRQFIKSSKANNFTTRFLASIAIHESDLRESVTREYVNSSGRVWATDSGLMQKRCILSENGKTCVNGDVKGLPVAVVRNPLDTVLKDGTTLPGNIELGARELARIYRGIPIKVIVKTKGNAPKYKIVMCPHAKHAWFHHYNGVKIHNGVEIKHQFYAHGVASIYSALSDATGQLTMPELEGAVLYVDKKGRKRMLDRPITSRHKDLYARIQRCKGTCSAVASTGGPTFASAVARVP